MLPFDLKLASLSRSPSSAFSFSRPRRFFADRRSRAPQSKRVAPQLTTLAGSGRRAILRYLLQREQEMRPIIEVR
jgi:hypothetical protein